MVPEIEERSDFWLFGLKMFSMVDSGELETDIGQTLPTSFYPGFSDAVRWKPTWHKGTAYVDRSVAPTRVASETTWVDNER